MLMPRHATSCARQCEEIWGKETVSEGKRQQLMQGDGCGGQVRGRVLAWTKEGVHVLLAPKQISSLGSL